jgi:hypothetical protein
MYLDPGFGGMLIQIIVALAAAGGALVFATRKKLRELFSRGNKDSETSSTAAETEATEITSEATSEDDVIDMLSDE